MSPNHRGALEGRIEQLEDELSRIHSQHARQVQTRLWTLAVLLAIPAVAWASTLDIPFSFSNGTIADANQVNANFAATETAVDDNDTRITSLEGAGYLHGIATTTQTGSGVERKDCAAGRVVIGGGCIDISGSGQIVSNSPFGNGWQCESRHYSTNALASVQLTLLCADPD